MFGKIAKAIFYIIFCWVYFINTYIAISPVMRLYELSSFYAWIVALPSSIIIFFALRAALNQKIPKVKRFAFSLGFVILQSVLEVTFFTSLNFLTENILQQSMHPKYWFFTVTQIIIACVKMAIFVAFVLLFEKLFSKKRPSQTIHADTDSVKP
ncbi:MAG: hypothetical protein MK052_00535 [Alphaproteobacteria bacterium]|nr:hypothetical protein [Alphaproteobacteria bacterium]